MYKRQELDLVDGGLRYDLTVPLCRYYSNNANELPSPFKALQMGNVWRADRPQRGRYRQFMQCDIDILGEPTILAEIELILATTTLLGKLDFKNFTIRINDRRILKAMAAYSGFAEADYDTVFIILDKMDKIGLDGVKEELLKEGKVEEAAQVITQDEEATMAASVSEAVAARRKSLPKEAKYLYKYLGVEPAGAQIVNVLQTLKVDPKRSKNVVILGQHGFGLTMVGEDFAKFYYDMGICKSEAKAKVKAKVITVSYTHLTLPTILRV